MPESTRYNIVRINKKIKKFVNSERKNSIGKGAFKMSPSLITDCMLFFSVVVSFFLIFFNLFVCFALCVENFVVISFNRDD
jgi:hypothetical protein